MEKERTGYNLYKGERCCWRCGVSQKDLKKEYETCSVQGEYYKKHLFKLKYDE